MPVTGSADKDGKEVTITIQGRFDFSMHREFRDCYRKFAKSGVHYRVVMSEAEYMDSSALGMLLLLREHAGGDAGHITIERVPTQIRRILEIANFNKLFKIL